MNKQNYTISMYYEKSSTQKGDFKRIQKDKVLSNKIDKRGCIL